MALSLFALSTTPASAALTKVQIGDILSRIGDGTWSERDLQTLKTFAPTVAAQVIDPSYNGESTAITSPRTSAASPLAIPTGCRNVDKSYHAKTLLGFTAYYWHHYSRYCFSGGKITSWPQSYDYVTNLNSAYRLEGITSASISPMNSSSANAFIQRRIDNCVVEYGCFASFYPWSRTTAYGSTGYDSEQGSAG